ncbi:hypothetical protein HPB49_020566 [Dermacentor silvarum]|uniref:Uncharacterized protein n=1 Tax=Dermacentor silvarum TaxID=543639 RepID=A0ACB8E3R5_DERSI|nr:hypothetical protein HPB49_020566 [Dermacentor silvarum]
MDTVLERQRGEKTVEDMSSGIEYCRLMHMAFPKSVKLARVKLNVMNEPERLYNFKLLQEAFDRVGIRKHIPVDRLIKGRFQDNLEFLQWFKKMFDVNHSRHHQAFVVALP